MNALTTTDVARREDAGCLQCGARLELDQRLLVGEVVQCERCEAQLEVADVDPVRLAPLARIEEEAEDFESWG